MQSQYLYIDSNLPAANLNGSQPLQAKKSKKSLALVVVGAVALCGVAATLALSSSGVEDHGIRFYGDDLHAPKTQAFLNFLAKHGKTYATKNDLNSRFEIFSANYDKIEEHNA